MAKRLLMVPLTGMALCYVFGSDLILEGPMTRSRSSLQFSDNLAYLLAEGRSER